MPMKGFEDYTAEEVVRFLYSHVNGRMRRMRECRVDGDAVVEFAIHWLTFLCDVAYLDTSDCLWGLFSLFCLVSLYLTLVRSLCIDQWFEFEKRRQTLSSNLIAQELSPELYVALS